MGFYRRVDIRMHGDTRYLSLSAPTPNGRSLFEWLIHGPFSNSIGLYPAGQMAMAEALGWPSKGFAQAFAEVIGQGLVLWCEDHRMIYLPNFLKHNPPGSTNVAKGWIKLLDSLPECHLINEWIQQFQAFAKAFPEAFKQGIPNGILLAVRTSPSPSPAPSPSPSPLNYIVGNGRQEAMRVLAWLNEKSGKNFRMTATNVDLIVSRMKGGISPDQLKAIVTRKCRQWASDEKMREFLRPATLFNRTNCEQYVGELPKIEETLDGVS